MKTKEELSELKKQVGAAEQKLETLEKGALKTELHTLDKELTALSDEELKTVTAGTAFTAGTYAFTYLIHNNCGGMIHNVGNPFACCYCDRCGERHYWHFSFDYTEVAEE